MDKERGSFRIAAKILNRGSSPLVLPVFHFRMRSRPEITCDCETDFFLAPGKSCYLVTGGISYELDKDLGHAELNFLDNDWYTPKTYVEYQLRNLTNMTLTVISTTFHPSNDSCSIKARFENNTDKNITKIEGSAVFLDANEQIVDAYPFQFSPTKSGIIDMWIADVPGAAKEKRCILQINLFKDTTQTVPNSIPPAPSVL